MTGGVETFGEGGSQGGQDFGTLSVLNRVPTMMILDPVREVGEHRHRGVILSPNNPYGDPDMFLGFGGGDTSYSVREVVGLWLQDDDGITVSQCEFGKGRDLDSIEHVKLFEPHLSDPSNCEWVFQVLVLGVWAHFMVANHDGPRLLLDNIKTPRVARVFDVDAIIAGIRERMSVLKGAPSTS